MLPTEKATSVIKQGVSSTLYYYSKPASAATKHLYVNQHLYFISDEEIKLGDYYFRLGAKEIYRGSGYTNDCRKVIASTEKLVDVPLIPQEFIENYCEVGGVDEVEIEYEEDNDPNLWGQDIGIAPLRIKVDSNNCVFTHPIKDSWSREEVEKLIESAVHNFSNMDRYDYDNLNRWIKDNL